MGLSPLHLALALLLPPIIISRSCMNNLAKPIPRLAILYITAPEVDTATKISTHLLERRLIACCNIVREVQSLYFWQGKLNNDSEVLMVLKSRQDLVDEIVAEVAKVHPYEVPEVIAVPVIGGSPKYVDWVLESTRQPACTPTQGKNQ